MADPVLLLELVAAVGKALEDEATRRSDMNRPDLNRSAQEALAIDVLKREFKRVEGQRAASGKQALSVQEENWFIDRVLAHTVGLGPIDVLLADERVEEVMFARFDNGLLLLSDGTRVPVDEQFFLSEKELAAWLAQLARSRGRTERQFNAQSPLLVMRIGHGLRLAATRDVSQHVSFVLRRNTLGDKVRLADLAGRQMFPAVLLELFTAFMRSDEMRFVIVGRDRRGQDDVGPCVSG